MKVGANGHQTIGYKIPLVARIVAAAMLTGLVAAILNFFYERLAAPELYSSGPPFARALFVFVVATVAAALGLALIGLPLAYVLERQKAHQLSAYVVAGAVGGAVWGALLGATQVAGIAICTFLGTLCAMIWWRFTPTRN